MTVSVLKFEAETDEVQVSDGEGGEVSAWGGIVVKGVDAKGLPV